MSRRTFDTMKNGYHRYQVDDCIQGMEDSITTLKKQLEVDRKDKKELLEELEKVKESYKNVSENLQVKEKAANDLARMAMREANRIVDTANDNADMIIKEALMMARGILLDIARLGNEANDLKSNMHEELARIALALDEFEAPAIPDMDLLKRDL